jgi:hypothetical protein
VEKLLKLYQPFIHDNDYEFVTGNIRELDRGLSAEERRYFGWNIATIDWRTYWLDIQYPGLRRWSIPLIHGDDVASDPAPQHPVRLRPVEPEPIPSSPAALPPPETHA